MFHLFFFFSFLQMTAVPAQQLVEQPEQEQEEPEQEQVEVRNSNKFEMLIMSFNYPFYFLRLRWLTYC